MWSFFFLLHLAQRRTIERNGLQHAKVLWHRVRRCKSIWKFVVRMYPLFASSALDSYLLAIFFSFFFRDLSLILCTIRVSSSFFDHFFDMMAIAVYRFSQQKKLTELKKFVPIKFKEVNDQHLKSGCHCRVRPFIPFFIATAAVKCVWNRNRKKKNNLIRKTSPENGDSDAFKTVGRKGW